MNSVTPVILAILLATSLLAMPVIAAGPSIDDAVREDPEQAIQQTAFQQLSSHQEPTEVEETTNRLPLTGDVRDEQTDHGADLGMALAGTNEQLRVDHEQYTLIDGEFATASDEDRESMVRSAHSQIQDRIKGLEEREREAVRDHANGDSSETELIQTLLRNNAEAAALEDALDRLTNERTDEIPGYSLSNEQIRADETLLELQQTSLRASLAQASGFGESDDYATIRVQTSEDGYSLSTIEGDMYVRETVRFDNRFANGVDQFEAQSYSETMDHTAERYPWAGGEQGWSAFSDSSNENLYIMTMEGDQDRLTVYLDAATGEVYHEAQELSLESLPEDGTETWIDDGLELSLTKTPADGPASVTVIDTATGEPAKATVTVDGTEVGQTDEDGTLWFVPPIGEYDLTVEADAGHADVTVD